MFLRVIYLSIARRTCSVNSAVTVPCRKLCQELPHSDAGVATTFSRQTARTQRCNKSSKTQHRGTKHVLIQRFRPSPICNTSTTVSASNTSTVEIIKHLGSLTVRQRLDRTGSKSWQSAKGRVLEIIADNDTIARCLEILNHEVEIGLCGIRLEQLVS